MKAFSSVTSVTGTGIRKLASGFIVPPCSRADWTVHE